MGRTRRHGRPPEVTVLVALYLVATVLCTVGAVLPPTPESPVALNAVAAVTGAAGAGLLWVRGRAVPRVWLHLAVVVYLVLSTGLVAQAVSGEGAISIGFSYAWMCLYAVVYLGHRPARVYAGLSSLGLGLGLTMSVPRATGASAWLVVAASLVVATEAAARTHARLQLVAGTDPLTGALNRAGFALIADREVADARRRGTPLSVVVFDMDGFKLVNDQQGHAAGDELLARFASELRRHLRPRDALARFGGDEFVLLLPDTAGDDATRLVVRLRSTTPLSWSSGVATMRPDDDMDTCLSRADARMYDGRQSVREVRRPGPQADRR